jgi:hypothetical protein
MLLVRRVKIKSCVEDGKGSTPAENERLKAKEGGWVRSLIRLDIV